MLIRDGKYEEAIPHLKVAMKIDPEEEMVYILLAKAQWNLHRKNEALEAVIQAFVLRPYDPEIVGLIRDIFAATPQLRHMSGSNDPFLIDITTRQYATDRILQLLLVVGEYLKNPRLLEWAPQLAPLVVKKEAIFNIESINKRQ
jgi:tetratricopeptide (TPR) repeat protein